MKELPSDTEITADIGVDTLITVGSISEYGMPDIRHMHTDLMRTTRLDATLEKGECWIFGFLDFCILGTRNS